MLVLLQDLIVSGWMLGINKSLIKMIVMKNLNDLLYGVGEVNKGQKVATSLIAKLEIYAFIPMCEYNGIDFMFNEMFDGEPFLGKVDVYGNRIVRKLKKNDYNVVQRYPIFSKVSLMTESHISLTNLYIAKYWNEAATYNKNIKEYKDFLRSRRTNINNRLQGIEKDENNNYVYKPNNDELFFSCDNLVTAVADRYYVICRRINEVTGELIYEIYEPNELVPIA